MKNNTLHTILAIFLFLTPYLNFAQAPDLGTAACYAIFSGNGAVSNAGVSTITGDIGTNNGLTTGFDSLLVTGEIHPIPDSSTLQCSLDLAIAYNYLLALPFETQLMLPAQFGNGMVLTPQVYLLDAATTLSDTLYFDAQNDPDAVFIIQINGALSASTHSYISLINQAKSRNIYWKVDGAVSINDYSVFHGIIIVNNAAISLVSVGVELYGKMLTTNGAVSTTAITAINPIDCSASLPLQLLNFTTKKTGAGGVQIDWIVATETDKSVYEIQHSMDAIHFSTIGTVPSTELNMQTQDYQFFHHSPSAGVNYYRLCISSISDAITYSNITAVEIEKTNFLLFPNPAYETIAVYCTDLGLEDNFSLKIIDAQGKTVQLVWVFSNNMNISLADLAAGVYWFKFNNQKTVYQVVKN